MLDVLRKLGMGNLCCEWAYACAYACPCLRMCARSCVVDKCVRVRVRVRVRVLVCSQNIYIDGSEPGQSTEAEYEITDGYRISSPGNLRGETI